jgi:hypothetical protein
MRHVRRLTLISALAFASLVASSSPAFADLEEYLEQAEQADYTGRRLVVTFWGDGSEVGVFDVTHAGDTTMIDGGQTASGSDGRVTGGQDRGAVVLQGWSRSSLTDRYTTAEPVAVTRLGRDAESVDVLEAGKVRARIVFDRGTRVPLLTEIFDGNGELFRYSAMIDFDPNPPLRYADLAPNASDYDVMLPAESNTMPSTAAGYVRADTYAGPDDTVQTFYTDGLFKFSIFEVVGDVALERFEAAAVLEANDANYLQLVAPNELWVMWSAKGSTYVLVGDLPPDHLVRILAELPVPEDGGLFNRIWHSIFG